jgi:putative pyruvate formate lyase activating enzyme
LPGHWDCCGRLILDWLSENLPHALVNIMDQYHPDYLVPIKESLASINRSLSSGEFAKALEYADEIGIRYGSVI